MYECIFTIGCFDKFHKGHLKLLTTMREQCEKLIVGIHDNESIKKLKNITDIYPLEQRVKHVKKYADDIFEINNVDPTETIQKYISDKFNNDLSSILIGTSITNQKIIKNITHEGELYFSQENTKKYKYNKQNTTLVITRVDTNNGWDEPIYLYKKKWCFMRGNDNINFPSMEYIKQIMPIIYLPYSSEISSTKLRNYKTNKIGAINYLLKSTVSLLKEQNIVYYLDKETLESLIKYNTLLETNDTLYLTIPESEWVKICLIDFSKHNLIIIQKSVNSKHEDSNILSIKLDFSEVILNITTTKLSVELDEIIINGETYNIPKNHQEHTKLLK